MLKLPYGLADFTTLRDDGYLYLDRTDRIPLLEQLGRTLLFVRPRRFGKSLWLRTLRAYHDLRLADRFEQLFDGLDAGRRPADGHSRYLILEWDFSLVDPRGSVDDVARSLREHVRSRVADFVADYRTELPDLTIADGPPEIVLDELLRAVRQSPHRLYLLIDEYDNFVNEVMVRDTGAYRALMHKDGPFKQLFKTVKAAVGRGVDRIFVTGVSPVALNDLSSGFNIARDVSRHPQLATLCGFTESEIADVVDRSGVRDAGETVELMRVWYNGYRFAPTAAEQVYNPTSCLYLLQEVLDTGAPPDQLGDRNLAMDQGKLAFLSREAAGAEVVAQLLEGDGSLAIGAVETDFTLEDLLARMERSPRVLASFLYYLGLLTHVGEPAERRLGIPNLVVRKLYLQRMLELWLPGSEDRSGAESAAEQFFRDGDVAPLAGFIEDKLLPVLSNRDAARWSETALKTLLLAMLFDDTRYSVWSEPEWDQGYADLCLLVRPQRRGHGLRDLLFELKYVALRKLGRSADDVRRLTAAELRDLTAVRHAADEARAQLERYRRGLERRLGDDLELGAYVVVAVGFARLVAEEVSGRAVRSRF